MPSSCNQKDTKFNDDGSFIGAFVQSCYIHIGVQSILHAIHSILHALKYYIHIGEAAIFSFSHGYGIT